MVGFCITPATIGIILLMGRNFETSIVLFQYSWKYASHIVIHFLLKYRLSCMVCTLGANSLHRQNPRRSHATTAKVNKAIIIQIQPGITFFEEKYIPHQKTIASVGKRIPMGVAISKTIMNIIPASHHVSTYFMASGGTIDGCSWVACVRCAMLFFLVSGNIIKIHYIKYILL